MATSHIVWNWATSTNLNFNAATDILDFGWFSADQFTISEVDGTVVIAIPSNHQTYTLQHTTLRQVHLSNILAKDASAIAEWTAALSNTPVTPLVPPEPPVAPPPSVVPPSSGATTWSASGIYTAGMTTNNRCYIRIYKHTRRTRTPQPFDYEVHQVYDAKVDDLLASASIRNGKKDGSIWDQSFKGERFFKDGDASWKAAIAYMDELMADPRKP